MISFDWVLIELDNIKKWIYLWFWIIENMILGFFHVDTCQKIHILLALTADTTKFILSLCLFL